ncbi:MAG TPA: ATP-binding protein [Syntrophales bacterium]|nr:ATP-binding protein [Syntrophales bacterium]
MKKRLLFKIVTGYLAIVLLTVSVMGYLTAAHLKSGLTERTEGELTAFGRMMSLMSLADIQKNALSLARASHSRITLIDGTGKVVLDTDQGAVDLDNHSNRPEIQEARIKGQGSSIRYSQTLRTDMIYFALALRDGDRIKGYIRLAKPLVELQAAAAKLYKMIFQTILIVLIPSMLIAIVFFFRIVTPIREIEEYTRKVRENDKQAMLMIDSDDEIGSLSRNINYMVQFQQEKINQLREEKGKLEATFASMMEGIMVLNAEHKIEAFNNSMLNMIGVGFPDIIGKTPIETLRSAPLQDALDYFLETGEPVTKEISIGVDNRVILEVSISAISGLPGDERKIMMVFHDVTRLRKLELIRADFVANVTHELKTPLTAIIGFVETLQEVAMNEKQTAEQFLKKIGENAYRLNRLVNDLLILSNLEAGETKLELRSIQVGDVLRDALPVIEGAAGAKGIIIHHEIPSDLPPISADREKVIQVFLNVLDNAVKFTDSGRVSITASVVNKGCVTVNIADTGIGIPYSDIPRLGERFYRVDKTRSREPGGTGLGLSIVKHLMNAHRGRMKIESVLGGGTTVSLDFPISD